MRVLFRVNLKELSFIPYEYQYQLHAAIYKLIDNSSEEYSKFIHCKGYEINNRVFKLFTFSKLIFHPGYKRDKFGFSNISGFDLYFSSPIEKTVEHIVIGSFKNQKLNLQFKNNGVLGNIIAVETVDNPIFIDKMNFHCLSPIASSHREQGKMKRYFDYQNNDEKMSYINGIYNNLIKKYELVHDKKYEPKGLFQFQFDENYIQKKRSIRKNIKFKRNPVNGKFSRIIGFEAPFTIFGDPELIKIGYECGFGENNSQGFGMVK